MYKVQAFNLILAGEQQSMATASNWVQKAVKLPFQP
jgi:hypothetical protein